MHRRRNMAISESQIQSELQLCDEFKEAIDSEWEKAKHEFSEQKAAVIERRKALETLLKTQGATSKQGALFDMPPVSQIGVGKKQRGKISTRVIQEIPQERGPLHVSDIVELGRQRGIAFEGRRKPEQIARDKFSASKRFELLGDNVWAIAGETESNLIELHSHRQMQLRSDGGHTSD